MPGDKPISHRAAILAAMANGQSLVNNPAPGRDVAATVDCLRRLGVVVQGSDNLLRVEGKGWQVSEEGRLDALNSATTMRLMSGALAGRPGEFVISGDESLSKRPMDRVAEPLRRLGAEVTLADGRFPPVGIVGGRLRGITYELPVASGQVKGAILLAGLQADGTTRVLERYPARDHTERMLVWLQAPVEAAPGEVVVEGAALPLPAFELTVPGDFSSAAYAIVAALLIPEGDLLVEDVGINPSRTGLLDVLRSMGASLEVQVQSADPEPSGSIRVVSTPELGAAEVEGDLVVRSVDELSLVALAATQAEGTTIVRDAEELRVKESDRVAVLVEGLRALGGKVEEAPDGFSVTGPTPLSGGHVDSQGDHRMALTFAVAGLIAREPVTITGWEWTEISYPTFEDDLRALVG